MKRHEREVNKNCRKYGTNGNSKEKRKSRVFLPNDKRLQITIFYNNIDFEKVYNSTKYYNPLYLIICKWNLFCFSLV